MPTFWEHSTLTYCFFLLKCVVSDGRSYSFYDACQAVVDVAWFVCPSQGLMLGQQQLRLRRFSAVSKKSVSLNSITEVILCFCSCPIGVQWVFFVFFLVSACVLVASRKNYELKGDDTAYSVSWPCKQKKRKKKKNIHNNFN